ncbi:eukaryotic translation initiation factor 3 subunit C-like protein [Exaiptasia diaphana]|uniref:Eukaryotic translation initiation factor 3 subunit C n=1 Tax=Exaiptasia diaphana TaxID=2652724 RepID=A0A913WVC0_EXADI|nr:eukaryotic translation initiation factor 3 subunit C-like protein [Exaiptasia diaphana]KXJ27749.1 Eukaryotic translation initiation factor 3 subunit C [Exaiptasia diaphana]
MSKFFAASSESESESSEDDQPIVVKQAPAISRAFVFSDDEEETKRVVRSQKDKRFDELKNVIKQLKNYKKIKDMSKVFTEFENLGKAANKAKGVIDKEGIPQFYIRCLANLEDFVKENWEDTEGRKKLSKVNAKALSTLRQKLKKFNKDYEADIDKYRENPVLSGESEREDSGSDSDSDKDFERPAKSETSKIPDKKAAKDESDSDSIDWDSTESSSESDLDEKGAPMELTASMFLKKNKDTTVKKEKKVKKKKDTKIIKEREEEDNEGFQEVQSRSDKTKHLFPKDTEITHPVVLKKLHEILGARGKKGTDRTEQIGFLKELRRISDGANLGETMTAKLMFNIISSIFDYNPNVATCMKAEMWMECLKQIGDLLFILENNPNIVVGENILEENETFDKPDQIQKIRGCVLTVIERMDAEYVKMLQGCDCHSTEYVDRLKDEKSVCELIERLQKYLEGCGTREELCRVYLLRIEHIYYKIDVDMIAKPNTDKDATEDTNKSEEKERSKETPSSAEIMSYLCKYIYSKDTSDRIRTRAMLCHIYHHALHDRWFEARDLILMSHLQETIQFSDIPTQILYNRTMVQLGLCAFRHGMIKDAHNALHDIQSSGRAKELLAQGLMQQRQYERTPEQEKIEKRRQVPFHMHINLELLECVYLTSAMLMEVPYMAAHAHDLRRRIISKSFHYQLRLSDKQTLVGPPESMREHVVAASKAMMTGNWKKCKNYIMAVKVWKLFSRPEEVKEMLLRKIQEESLRTYLFTYNSMYDSLSLHTLAEMFELPPGVVHSIISKMIINEELQASWDEPTQTVVMHHGAEPTLVQNLALQLAEKIGNLVENNERIYDSKHGGGFYQYKERQGDRRFRQRGQQQNY